MYSSDGKMSSKAFLRAALKQILHILVALLWSSLNQILIPLRLVRAVCAADQSGIGRGKTVLVTTGRQAKTLHVVRALKAVGATVIVTDYDHISASALSLCTDHFVTLPPLDPNRLNEWIAYFRKVLELHQVDVVLPVSTINEVLFLAMAKISLRKELPHIKWLCPDLEQAMLLDDRVQFANLCERFGVPAPESGVLTSLSDMEYLGNKFSSGIIVKRVESTVNRSNEIVPIACGQKLVPAFVCPTQKDPWQWQRLIRGKEYSVWYVCVDGKVTFSSCYCSEADLVQFDPAPTPSHIDEVLRKLIGGLRLSGQYAFDFIREDETGDSFIIECNPRASSVLETVSSTPLWGEAFFGVDVTERTIHDSVGFLYHGNCWPFSSRSEGYFKGSDPLPIFGAEVVWPLHAIASKGLSENMYQGIDVNICKIITDGLSPGRGFATFSDVLRQQKMQIAQQALGNMDTLLLDMSIPGAVTCAKNCAASGVKVIPFQTAGSPGSRNDFDDFDVNVLSLPEGTVSDEFLEEHRSGETRILLGEALSKSVGSLSHPSYHIVVPGRTWNTSYEIPLRKLRVLHVMGSCSDAFYEGLSSCYGYQCINSIGHESRFEHMVAYVHRTGKWSVEEQFINESYIKHEATQMCSGEALTKIESLNVDVVIPHMFDYVGMTAFRAVFDVLQLPMVGCTAEALALSTHKGRTNACAAMAGVRVPQFEVLRKGESPSIPMPFVIKPCEEDNSLGVQVVKTKEQVEEALEQAFEFGDEVMCETFIAPGRELRIAVVENSDGSLEMLPIIEYLLSEALPVRTSSDKVKTDDRGAVTTLVGTASGGTVLPAKVDADLKAELLKAACTAHRALGCRDYSIYDFRVDREGVPYMLESCLYCSFSPKSVLVKMQGAVGINKRQLFERLCEKAMTRRAIATGQSKKVGMKRR